VWLAVSVAAFAADPPLPPPPVPAVTDPAVLQRIADLEAKLVAVDAQLTAKEQEDLMREAEALATENAPPPPPPPAPRNIMNPSITAFGDLLASAKESGAGVDKNSGPWLRAFELDIRADVDPYAKAVAVVSFEQEDPIASGEYDHFEASPEEAYVDLVSLPGGFSARLGKFRQPFGVTNKTHAHDLPWSDLPTPLTGILGDEGYSDTGALVDWHLASRSGTGLTLEGAVLSGNPWDEAHETGSPAVLGRAELFRGFGSEVNVGLGASIIALPALNHEAHGADLLFRWKKNEWRSVVIIAEALADNQGHKGGFAALQLQPTRPIYLGGRVDDLDGDVQAGGFISYYTSEFLRFRAGAMAGSSGVREDLQLTFVWGSHPVEPYWVNR
jgi:hypothetical protein